MIVYFYLILASTIAGLWVIIFIVDEAALYYSPISSFLIMKLPFYSYCTLTFKLGSGSLLRWSSAWGGMTTSCDREECTLIKRDDIPLSDAYESGRELRISLRFSADTSSMEYGNLLLFSRLELPPTLSLSFFSSSRLLLYWILWELSLKRYSEERSNLEWFLSMMFFYDWFLYD